MERCYAFDLWGLMPSLGRECQNRVELQDPWLVSENSLALWGTPPAPTR